MLCGKYLRDFFVCHLIETFANLFEHGIELVNVGSRGVRWQHRVEDVPEAALDHCPFRTSRQPAQIGSCAAPIGSDGVPVDGDTRLVLETHESCDLGNAAGFDAGERLVTFGASADRVSRERASRYGGGEIETPLASVGAGKSRTTAKAAAMNAATSPPTNTRLPSVTVGFAGAFCQGVAVRSCARR